MAERKGLKARLFNKNSDQNQHLHGDAQGHSSKSDQEKKQQQKSVIKKVFATKKDQKKYSKDDPRYHEQKARQEGMMQAGNTFLDYYEKAQNPHEQYPQNPRGGPASECDKRSGKGKEKKKGKVQSALRFAKMVSKK